MNWILSILVKYLISDLFIIITSFVCMWFVLKIYFPEREKKRFVTLLLIEGFEHLIMPIVLFFILLFTNSYKSALLFHITIITFLFGFVGLFVLRARSKRDWFKVLAVAGFTYLFIFIYPFMIILTQIYTPLNGFMIMGITIAFFWVFYLLTESFV